MMFRFYGIAFYFLNNFILVIEIVIVCFKKLGKSRRDEYQQSEVFLAINNDADHSRRILTK